MKLKSLNPAVDKKVLLFVAGAAWCSVGILLVSYAIVWLGAYSGNTIIFYAAGFIIAMPVHHFGFLRLADKNIQRLLPLKEKRCIFSFVTWKSYLIIIIMMTMGIMLRHSSVPKEYLAVLYSAIGLALFLSGIRYMRNSLMLILSKNANSGNNN